MHHVKVGSGAENTPAHNGKYSVGWPIGADFWEPFLLTLGLTRSYEAVIFHDLTLTFHDISDNTQNVLKSQDGQMKKYGACVATACLC